TPTPPAPPDEATMLEIVAELVNAHRVFVRAQGEIAGATTRLGAAIERLTGRRALSVEAAIASTLPAPRAIPAPPGGTKLGTLDASFNLPLPGYPPPAT